MLSVIIITKNESRNISRCLESVVWADEIIVLDSGSDDNTVSLCQRYTDLVYETDWPGFGPQKQRALEKTTGDWVLSMDADEWLTPELTSEIQQAITQSDINGYWIPRLSSYCGKEIRHGGWWPDYVLRLFQRNQGRFTEDRIHERIIVDGRLAKLNSPIMHESFVNLEEVLDKVNHYSSLGAEKLYNAGKKASIAQAILKGLWTFFRTYCLKAAFLDGGEGLILSISNAEGAYYKYLKLWYLAKQDVKK